MTWAGRKSPCNFRSWGPDVTGSAEAIDRILVIDDDPGAREGFAYSIEDLGLTPVPEAGPITHLDRFVAEVPRRAQAVVCDYRLKTTGEYSSFNGDELVAACYRHRIPGLLCTQYTDVATEMNRRLLRFIPALLRTSSPEPDAIRDSLRRCQDELQGVFRPARKAWRTLVRIDDVSQDGRYCHVIVPAWNPHQAIRIYLQDIPQHVLLNMRTGLRVHAKVNIGAESFEDVYFDEWEPE